MGILSDIAKNIGNNPTAKDFAFGAVGAIIGALTTRFVFDKNEEYDEDSKDLIETIIQ